MLIRYKNGIGEMSAIQRQRFERLFPEEQISSAIECIVECCSTIEDEKERYLRQWSMWDALVLNPVIWELQG